MFTVTKYSSVDDANDSYIADDQLCVVFTFMSGETYEVKTNQRSAKLFQFANAFKHMLKDTGTFCMFQYINSELSEEVSYDTEINSDTQQNNASKFNLLPFITIYYHLLPFITIYYHLLYLFNQTLLFVGFYTMSLC